MEFQKVKKFDQSGFIRIHSRNEKSYTEVLAIAEKQKTVGQINICEFVNKKILRELVTKNVSCKSKPAKLS